MIQKQRSVRRRNNDFPVGLMLFMILSIVFMCRFVNIFLNNETRDSHAYVQILNAGLPVAKGTYYDEASYEESIVDIKSLVKETLGIDKIDPSTILAMQIPGFNGFNQYVKANVETQNDVDKFVLNDESIDKKTEEEKPKPEADASGVRNPNIVKELDESNPEVLLYQTHSDEGFTVPGHFTPDTNYNIVGVGEFIAKELEEYYGIAVIHDKTKHDTMYEDSYERSRETVKRYSQEYPNGFDIIVDLHRDSVGMDKKHVVTREINGENLATLILVDTQNSKNFASTNAMNQRIFNMSEELFPGLTRHIRTVQRGRSMYNQDIMPNTTLIEVGAEANLAEEAHRTAQYVARLIAEEVHYKNNNP